MSSLEQGAPGPDEAMVMGPVNQHEFEVSEDLSLLTAALAELPGATLMVFDRDLRYRLVRGGALPGRELSTAALEGRAAPEALGPERWRLYEDSYRNALKGVHSTFEVPAPLLDRLFNVRVAPLHDPAGEVIGGVSMAVEVTDQVRMQEELRASETHFRLLAENASDVVLRIADGGVVSWVSPSVERLLGWAVDDLVGTNSNQVIAPEDLDSVRAVVAGLDPSDPDGSMRCRVLSAEGSERWMAARIRLVPAEGSMPVSFVVALRDIAEEMAALADRDERDAELALIVETSPDVIVRLDTDLRVTFVNHTVRSIDTFEDERVGRRFLDVAPPEEAVPVWDAELHAALRDGEPRTFEIQGREDLDRPWWDVRIVPSRNAAGAVSHLTLILRDITSRKAVERELFIAATHDPLTGLANRAEVLSEIERATSAAARSMRATAVLMLDLDHFKNVNDSLGHAVGDRLLVAAAQRLASLVRTGDMAGRLGGDEFVVVMRELDDPTEAARVGERIIGGFREPLTVGELALIATASIGLTVATPDGGKAHDAAALLREADTALYRAKGSGRDSLSFFNDDLRAEVAERLRVEDALRGALERRELELWYQPEVDLDTGAVRAVEALLRWRQPSGEVLPAERFIEIAEDTGLIVDIGDWVIHEACARAATWAARHPEDAPVVRINLSSAQLSEVGLVDELTEAVARTGVDPRSLCLEITEAALLHDLPTAQEKLAAIRAMGISIAIDAFGSGDSTIRCLEQCEVDVLKIDPSLGEGAVGGRMVAGVLALADSLGLTVTAKGVETTDQADALRDLGCGSGQGWLWSRAVEPERIDALLGRHHDA